MHRHLLPFLYLLLLGSVTPLSAQQLISNPPLPPENNNAFPVYALESLPALIDSSVLPQPERPWRYLPYGYDVPGRWEIGVHIMPWLANQDLFLLRMTDIESISILPQTFTGPDGQSYVLYGDSFSRLDVPTRPALLFLQTEIARQFSSGLRASASFAFYNDPNQREAFVEDLASMPNPPQYAQLFYFKERGVFFNLHLQYTLNRRGRLRPALGLIYVSRFAYRSNSSRILYDGPNEKLVVLNSTTDNDINGLLTNLIMPQFSLQYQLSRHFSLGLELAMPLEAAAIPQATLFGVGGRFQFGAAWPSFFDKG